MKVQRRTQGIIITAALFALLLVAALVFTGQVESKTEDNRLQTVKEAARRAAVTCYAVEGRYPEDVGYLVTNYGLVYDDDKYLIHYDAFASNILPDISVIVREVSK